MKYLLDTNVCVAVLRGDAALVRRLEARSPDDCAVSAITVYELGCGVARCANPERERRRVEALLAQVQVLAFHQPAAAQAALVRVQVEREGRTIGPYDILLAGHALSLGLVLVTRNQREFLRVKGLALEDWQS